MDRQPRRETRGPRGDIEPARLARSPSSRRRWFSTPRGGALRSSRRRARLIPTRGSQPAPSSVLSEVTRQLFGRCSPAQVADVLLLEDRLAIDRVLESFELCLEMLDARRERLERLLPTGVRRPGSRAFTSLPKSSHGRSPVLCGSIGQDLPTLSCGMSRERRGNETRRAINGRLAAHAGQLDHPGYSSMPRGQRRVHNGPLKGARTAAGITSHSRVGSRVSGKLGTDSVLNVALGCQSAARRRSSAATNAGGSSICGM